ncbi:serine carboxypeptidase [Mycena rosella]|uniref:Carboxypeptidase n=1 Tax=Mycena rosella TaxID=1033263 RepID=A0AAD7GU29_MYCRO|nr:serine carboxypeptidase [Mycena rosella]
MYRDHSHPHLRTKMRISLPICGLIAIGLPSILAFPQSPFASQQPLDERSGHPAFPHYEMRLNEPILCDSVQQYSGYIDVGKEKHLFFWFFESRSSPADDPLVLWLNGGPGGSSMLGLLFELGPCNIASENETTRNPHSWNTHANVIFLDQPVNTGYSYAGPGAEPVHSTQTAARDVYTFLQLFMHNFPQYARLPFHIAAESYGGIFAPNIASVIHAENKDAASSGLLPINLASILLGNALTDPLVQWPSTPEFACDGPFAVYDDPNGLECTALRVRARICDDMLRACYLANTEYVCGPAGLYCVWGMFGPLELIGVNTNDVRMKCDKTKQASCWPEEAWIQTFMNSASVRDAIGADPRREFIDMNTTLQFDFMSRGDGAHPTHELLPALVNDGVRLLVYAGNTDMVCNYFGKERWITQLETEFHAEFSAAPHRPWYTAKSGTLSGSTRSAGVKGGNVTFVLVHDAGHLVPHDQPEAAFDMFNRWIHNIPITTNRSFAV